jgi:anti-sigma factor RsiW
VGGREDLERALKAIVAAKREELGEPPAPEELLAYRDGELDVAARQALEARIALHPEVARTLADLAAFPDVEPAPGTWEPSEEDVAAAWQALRRRLGQPAASEPIRRPEAVEAPRATSPRIRTFSPLRLATAASILLALGWVAGFLTARAPRSDSAVNVAIVELEPVAEGARSSPQAVELPARSEELVLVLGLADEGEFPDYEAEILDAAGARLWARQGLRPTSLDTFHLAFRRGALPPGTYRAHLYGRHGERRTLLATYSLRFVEPPGTGEPED